MISILRWVLLPITLIYTSIVWVRNLLYDKNILKSTTFTIPTIVIGNLAIGGTGKSPLTEYIVRLLKENYKIATLSRGYGRKTKGYRLVSTDALAVEVGDEPLQFKNKFPNITVAVSEDRCFGVRRLADHHDLIILDDAYQHRQLNPGFSILLFDFKSLFSPIFLLPTGNFRDNFSATKRAKIIMITKCPEDLNNKHKEYIERKIRRITKVPIFYTGITYDGAQQRNNTTIALKNTTILLFCGIANPKPLEDYLIQNGNTVHLLKYPDHHNYTDKDFSKIVATFNAIPNQTKVILTTEKDMQRIPADKLTGLPLYHIPIRLKSMDGNLAVFDQYILNYLNNKGR